MNRTESDTQKLTKLKTAADKLADLVLDAEARGFVLPDAIAQLVFATIGMALTTVRRPEFAPAPVTQMIAQLETTRTEAQFAIIAHDTRAGGA